MNTAAPQRGFQTLFKNRNFLLLWLAQLTSMTILNASNYAIIILIQDITGSTTLIALAIICFSIPAVIIGAPAGVFVDHRNKRRVLFYSNILRAIATFGFVISLAINRNELITVFLLTFLISCIGQFFTPAEGASIPLLVSEEELTSALSLFNITFMLSQAVGFIILAPLILSLVPTFSIGHTTIIPFEVLYALIAVLYLVSALLISLIPAKAFTERKRERDEQRGTNTLDALQNVWNEAREGWSFIRHNNQLFLAVIQLSFAGVLLLIIGELATPLVTRLFHLPASLMAIVFAPAGVGLVVGSILMPRVLQRISKEHAIFIGSIVLAGTIALLPLSTLLAHYMEKQGLSSKPIYFVAVPLIMFTAGIAIDFINIPAQTAIQESTPEWIKGRVLALQLMLYNAISIPILLFIGGLADTLGIDKVIYLVSVSILGFGFWGRFYERRHRDLGPKDDLLDEKARLSEPERVKS
ncbi:MAG TPA: MFS transporter [Ktedonobacteraceae bacterium]|nr:MFS transporter [Ktedonobacteraceae bacterium]HYA98922.1 MFS transporter [Ktedonobacteraceae bacterium]